MKAAPPTGRTIILELVKELEERLYPLLYRVLPPTVYHVYLHPDDYREVEPVTAIIAADAQRGLTERVQQLNRRSRWIEMLQGQRPPIEAPAAGWQITIHPDANGELQLGQIGIVSRLSVPASPQFEGGTPTTRIARTVVSGTSRQTTTRDESAVENGGGAAVRPVPSVGSATAANTPPVTTPALNAPAVNVTRPNGPAVNERPAVVDTSTAEHVSDRQGDTTRRVARLAYVDEQGPHVFVMRKDVVCIGRGGSAHWVDVQVVCGPRVSREHCRIRRASDGRFYLQDLSTWGTSVDGQRVPPFLRTSSAGQLEETGDEYELRPEARIHLADAIVIDFQTLSLR